MTDIDPDKEVVVVIVARRCVYINDRRVVGNKPFASENLPQVSFTCTAGEIMEALRG